MSFLFPGFLIALLALIIPIIVHLFNFRRYKKVRFTNVNFLKELKEETDSKSKLKHLLVLFSRLLALSFLVFAFAQPYIPIQEEQISAGPEAVSIYIDNSLSMRAESEGIPLLDRAKELAAKVVKAQSETNRFQLISNELSPSSQRMLSNEEALSLIEEVNYFPAATKADDILARIDEALNRTGFANKTAYLISDFQQSVALTDTISGLQINLIPVQAALTSNLSIDSCWLDALVPLVDQSVKLFVRLKNSGDEAFQKNSLNFRLNDQMKAIREFNIEANSSIIDTFDFVLPDSGWNRIQLSIQDFPVDFDNDYFLALHVESALKVMSIYESQPNKYLQALFSSDPLFRYNQIQLSSLDYSSLKKQDVIVLSNLNMLPSGLASSLSDFVEAGGTLLIFPGVNLDGGSFRNLLNAQSGTEYGSINNNTSVIRRLNTESAFFRDVFERIPENIKLPAVFKHYPIRQIAGSGKETLLELRNGSAFFSRTRLGAGEIYLCASALDKSFTDFASHGLFVPTIYKVCLSGKRAMRLAHVLDQPEPVVVERKRNSEDEVLKVRGKKIEFIPRQNSIGNQLQVHLDRQIKDAGIYDLIDDQSAIHGRFALNHNRQESDLSYYSADELKKRFASAGIQIIGGSKANFDQEIQQIDQGIVLWKWCIVLVLLFLGIEILLLRLMK